MVYYIFKFTNMAALTLDAIVENTLVPRLYAKSEEIELNYGRYFIFSPTIVLNFDY